MVKQQITERLKRWMDKTNNNRNEVLQSKQFKTIIHRERCRADRFNHCFSLLTIEFLNFNSVLDHEKRIVKSLRKYCRQYDEIGWIDVTTLGILLYNTSYVDAERFAGRVTMLEELHMPYTIFTFPNNWFADRGNTMGKNTGNSGDDETRDTPANMQPDEVGAASYESNASGYSVDENFLKFEPAPLPVWKRSLDVAISLSAILLLSPLLALVSTIVILVSRGQLFYSQKRIGYNGKEFNFYKFRTMKVNNNCGQHKALSTNLIKEDVPMTKLYDDPRIIPLGKIIRNTSLDELPQLFNVLKGDMSIVGPRPCLPYEADQYERWHKQRFYGIPGLTGLWQVSGKNRLTFKQMVRLDIAYKQNMSFMQDMKIVFKTPLAIMEEFREAYKQKRQLAYN